MFPYHRGGCLLAVVMFALAIFLAIASARYQHPHDPGCYGQLGAGFPQSFLCDDTAGSPTSSWGKIDEVDWYGGFVMLSPAFLVNVLFYAVLLSIPVLLVLGISRLVRRHAPPR